MPFVIGIASFVGGIPEALRAAASLAEEDPVAAVLSARLFGAVFVLPLVLYALAGLVHLGLRVFGARPKIRETRIALFWSLLLSTPLMLLAGLGSAVLPEIGQTALSLIVFSAFLAIFSAAIAEIAGFQRAWRVFSVLICGVCLCIAIFVTLS